MANFRLHFNLAADRVTSVFAQVLLAEVARQQEVDRVLGGGMVLLRPPQLQEQVAQAEALHDLLKLARSQRW